MGGSIDLGMQLGSNWNKLVSIFDNLLENLSSYIDYILGFFTYLIESALNLLSNGSILFFVLFILIIWKVAVKLKG